MRERQLVVAEIRKEIEAVTKGLPITISNANLENAELPDIYMKAILAKEKAREDAKREQHNLDRQKIQAQQKVQTAEAERDAVKAMADGRAYQVDVVAVSRAAAIKRITAELSKSPRYIDYLKAKNWNGVMPTTMLGGGSNVLFSLGTSKK